MLPSIYVFSVVWFAKRVLQLVLRLYLFPLQWGKQERTGATDSKEILLSKEFGRVLDAKTGSSARNQTGTKWAPT